MGSVQGLQIKKWPLANSGTFTVILCARSLLNINKVTNKVYIVIYNVNTVLFFVF